MKKFFDIPCVPEVILLLIMPIPYVDWELAFRSIPGIETIAMAVRILSVLYVLMYVLCNGEKAGKVREAAAKRAKEQREIRRKEEFKKEYLSFREEMAQRMQKNNEQEER